MVDVQTVTLVVTCVSVVVGIIYYALQVRHQTKIRQADLIMRLHSQACDKEFVEGFQKIYYMQFTNLEDFINRYPAGTPEHTAVAMIASFMEGIGVLLHRKFADMETIKELFDVEGIWEKLGPILIARRIEEDNPTAWQWFEYLYNEIKKQ
jgi:hypothetical protein